MAVIKENRRRDIRFVLISICISFLVLKFGSTAPSSLAPVVTHEASASQQQQRHLKGDFQVVPNQCNSTKRGVFDKIYSEGSWQRGLRKPSDFYSGAAWPPNPIQQNSASGPGSNRGYMTVASLKVLTDAIVKYNVTSMVDIPCGDVNWIFDSYITDTLPKYIGLDVTSAVIDVNKQRFGHHRNKRFFFWDATECDMPMFYDGSSDNPQSVDLVHVRDVIQHLTLAQGVKYYCHVFKTRPRILVTTSHTRTDGRLINKDIKEGDCYDANIFLEPFSFPEGEGMDCFKHDAREGREFTCVFDLRKHDDWVQNYLALKC